MSIITMYCFKKKPSRQIISRRKLRIYRRQAEFMSDKCLYK